MVRSSSEDEAVNLEVWYSLDGHAWLGTKSVLQPNIIIFPVGTIRRNQLFGSDGKLRIIASSIKIKSSTKIEHSCFQIEVFGCKVDAEIDLKCDSALRVQNFTKSDPANNKIAVEDYFRESYHRISNEHKSVWIPQFMNWQESCELGTLEQ